MVTTIQFFVLIGLMLWLAPFYGNTYMARHGMAIATDGITAVRAGAASSSTPANAG
ncbi:hypothetical protein [Micromonospora sp. KLBMP9576]|uniref:hypothetical protein n=1 Tax=Micromonospora sp. KLBMP9576 TaxID=3424769 RepID=UPI003D8E2C4B